MILSLLFVIALQIDPGGEVEVAYPAGETTVEAGIVADDINSWIYIFDRTGCTDKETTIQLMMKGKNRSYAVTVPCGEMKNENGDPLKYSSFSQSGHSFPGEVFQATIANNKDISVTKPQIILK